MERNRDLQYRNKSYNKNDNTRDKSRLVMSCHKFQTFKSRIVVNTDFSARHISRKIVKHLSDRGVTLFLALGKRLFRNRGKFRRNLFVSFNGVFDILVKNFPNYFIRRSAGKRRFARQNLIKYRPQRINIGNFIYLADIALGLLRRHV